MTVFNLLAEINLDILQSTFNYHPSKEQQGIYIFLM